MFIVHGAVVVTCSVCLLLCPVDCQAASGDDAVPTLPGDYLFCTNMQCLTRKAHRWDFQLGPYVGVVAGREVAGEGVVVKVRPMAHGPPPPSRRR